MKIAFNILIKYSFCDSNQNEDREKIMSLNIVVHNNFSTCFRSFKLWLMVTLLIDCGNIPICNNLSQCLCFIVSSNLLLIQ